MTYQITDSAALAGTRRTADGYLVADVRIARIGIQIYRGSEVGLMDRDTVRVYRPASSVFDKAAMQSMAHRPVTVDHPAQMVTADTWKDVSVGQTGEDVVRDGDHVRVPMVVMDAAAIQQIEAGKRELSVGYTCDLAFEPGTTPDGEAYDAIQKDIRGNHLAIVQAGRAGSKARIGDAADSWGDAPLNPRKEPDMADQAIKTRTVLVDGLQVETTDAGAQAIDKLQTAIADKATAMTDAAKAHDAAIAAKDAEIAKKDAEIDDLKGKVLDDAALDKRVQDRADLIGKATMIAKDVKTAGLTDAAIRKAAVVAKLGDKAIEGKSDAYIDARFDILLEDAAKGADPFKVAVSGAPAQVMNLGDHQAQREAFYAKQAAELQDAWKGDKAKEA